MLLASTSSVKSGDPPSPPLDDDDGKRRRLSVFITNRHDPNAEEKAPATDQPEEAPASRIRHLRARKLRVTPQAMNPINAGKSPENDAENGLNDAGVGDCRCPENTRHLVG